MSKSTRVTGHRVAVIFLVGCAFAAVGLGAETILDRLARLSSDLSQGNTQGAISTFDHSVKGYDELSINLASLTAQTDVVCAIEVIQETAEGDVHKLDTDWFLQLKGQGEHGPTERRRERLQLEMRQVKGKWKITSISSIGIFAPLRIP